MNDQWDIKVDLESEATTKQIHRALSPPEKTAMPSKEPVMVSFLTYVGLTFNCFVG
jgi:hypothetical protein